MMKLDILIEFSIICSQAHAHTYLSNSQTPKDGPIIQELVKAVNNTHSCLCQNAIFSKEHRHAFTQIYINSLRQPNLTFCLQAYNFLSLHSFRLNSLFICGRIIIFTFIVGLTYGSEHICIELCPLSLQAGRWDNCETV